MARLIWAVYCKDAVIDKDSNNIYLQGILERVVVHTNPKDLPTLNVSSESALNDGVPGMPMESALVTLWARDDFEKSEMPHIRIRLVCPDNHSYGVLEQDIDLDQHSRMRVTAKFDGIPYRGAGEYDFIAELYDPENDNWVEKATVPLEVVVEPRE